MSYVKQALLTHTSPCRLTPEGRVAIEYLIRGMTGPRRIATLTGRAAEIAAGNIFESCPWQVICDWLIDHPEEIEGISPRHLAAVIAAVKTRGGWFATAL